MRTILFVGHAFHQKTKSSNFMLDLLRENFKVDLIAVDPENIRNLRVQHDLYDAVYLWQLDALAPYMMSLGLPTFVSPMYDASGGLPDAYWQIMSEARFINFSYTLNLKTKLANAKSLFVRYFPDPDTIQPSDFNGRMSAYFWQRRPEYGLNIHYVDRLIGGIIEELHIQFWSDVDGADDAYRGFDSTRYKVEYSPWRNSRTGLKDVSGEHLLYIAPRPAEGIGMAFLEAMARGQCVIANDAPTHNEYISNGATGILFNLSRSDQVAISTNDALQIGRNARQYVFEGFRNWQSEKERIIEFINEEIDVAKSSLRHHRSRGAALRFARDVYAGSINFEHALKAHNILELSNSKAEKTAQHPLDAPNFPSAGAFGGDGPRNEFFLDGWHYTSARYHTLDKPVGIIAIPSKKSTTQVLLVFHIDQPAELSLSLDGVQLTCNETPKEGLNQLLFVSDQPIQLNENSTLTVSCDLQDILQLQMCLVKFDGQDKFLSDEELTYFHSAEAAASEESSISSVKLLPLVGFAADEPVDLGEQTVLAHWKVDKRASAFFYSDRDYDSVEIFFVSSATADVGEFSVEVNSLTVTLPDIEIGSKIVIKAPVFKGRNWISFYNEESYQPAGDQRNLYVLLGTRILLGNTEDADNEAPLKISSRMD